MPIKNLVDRLAADYPNIQFKPGEHFMWSAQEKTVYYNARDIGTETFLLHELAHALLDHSDYDLDVELVRKESEAWHMTVTKLADKYGLDVSEKEAEMALESYRHWLFKRSKCPDCGTNGLQTKNTHYKCIVCGCSWRANDARVCELKRYRVAV